MDFASDAQNDIELQNSVDYGSTEEEKFEYNIDACLVEKNTECLSYCFFCSILLFILSIVCLFFGGIDYGRDPNKVTFIELMLGVGFLVLAILIYLILRLCYKFDGKGACIR